MQLPMNARALKLIFNQTAFGIEFSTAVFPGRRSARDGRGALFRHASPIARQGESPDAHVTHKMAPPGLRGGAAAKRFEGT